MMNEETKASLNKFLKEREERIKNMTLAEARDIISSIYGHSDMRMESDKALQMLLDCADKALEPKPMEKFEDVKTHIQRLAGDYKCWDNRLTWEEALELNRMLEAQPSEDDFVKHKKEVLERIAKREREIDKYIKELETLDQQSCKNKGEISDGHHTFNQLYHQRAILFATIVNQNKDKAWKSFKHSDGHYCFDEDGEMFIVGIDTPKGSYTYHYHKKYWDYFNCKELECGKVWDGHTEEDVTRLLSLDQQPPFINKPCVSEGVCREDKIQVLEKIRAEIQRLRNCSCSCSDGIIDDVEDIIDKYRAESEDKE